MSAISRATFETAHREERDFIMNQAHSEMLRNLSILIVTWNGDELLSNCLKSLRASCGDYPQIVIVDNANLKSTREIAERYPNSTYISTESNKGFAGGNNVGIGYCTGEYVLLLNNDIVVRGNPFLEMISYLKENPDVAVVQGKMRLALLGDISDTCGIMLSQYGLPFGVNDHGSVDRYVASGRVYAAKGACLMFKRDVLRSLGGVLFYDHFKSMYEEIDFCHRVWLSGREVHYLETDVIDHFQSQTIVRLSQVDVAAQNTANAVFSRLTTLGLYGLCTIGVKQIFLFSALFVYKLMTCKTEHLRIMFKALAINAKRWRQIVRTRRIVQRGRRVSDRALLRLFTVRLSFRDIFRLLKGSFHDFVPEIKMSDHIQKFVCAPVLLIGFNRPDFIVSQINVLRSIAPSRVYFAVDGARTDVSGELDLCEGVRSCVKMIDWPCDVFTRFRGENLGCKYAVSDAISWFFDNEELGIVLEDDCLPNHQFFKFATELLEKYRDNEKIGAINGFNYLNLQTDKKYDYHFSSHMDVWGWASWRRVWNCYDVEVQKRRTDLYEIIDRSCMTPYMKKVYRQFVVGLDNGLNTWDVQFSLLFLINGWLSVVPKQRLVVNAGIADVRATHTGGYVYWAKEWSVAGSVEFPLRHPESVKCDNEADRIRECYEGALVPRGLTWLGSKFPSMCGILTNIGKCLEKITPVLFRI